MEDELWPEVYRILIEEGNRRPRPPEVVYPDVRIVEVYLWAAIHDRPTGWACLAQHWPAAQRWRRLPSESTMSERLRSASVRLLLAAMLDRLAALRPPALARAVDSKPLPVGGYSKDRDARRGQACDGKARGYKLFDVWGPGVVPDAFTLGPMNRDDPDAAADLLARLDAAGRGRGGYLLGDATHDSNPLHAACAARGMQMLAPRKRPGTGLGHREHEPTRLRAVQMLEWPVRLGTAPSPFARDLYACRGEIERRLGTLCTFGGGLQPLPAWVRTPHRVALWAAAKLIFNGVRQCQLEGLAA
jgi:hypothetical protein